MTLQEEIETAGEAAGVRLCIDGEPTTLAIPKRKTIRAAVIERYVRAAGYTGVVCFTCGNAAEALRALGLDVIEVGPNGGLEARRWWKPAEIYHAWPTRFDATSGHLPLPLMLQVASALQVHIGPLQPCRPYYVPTGSGETVMCLHWAYPECLFVAGYDDTCKYTTYCKEAPLNSLVEASGVVVRRKA